MAGLDSIIRVIQKKTLEYAEGGKKLVIVILGFSVLIFFILNTNAPSIQQIGECYISKDTCPSDVRRYLFEAYLTVFFITAISCLYLIIGITSGNKKSLDEIRGSVALTMSALKGSISLVEGKDFDVFYHRAIDEMSRSTSRNSKIRATSSFTPPDEEMRKQYFDLLAKLIVKPCSPNYMVLMAKGSSDNWDELCRDELVERVKCLDAAARTSSSENGRDRKWEYGTDFTARRSKYHARMDFLIINNSVFLNINTSAESANDRGFVIIVDRGVAEIFERWFDTIWNHEIYSTPVHFNRRSDVDAGSIPDSELKKCFHFGESKRNANPNSENPSSALGDTPI